MFFYYDYYYLILIIPAMLIALWAQINVKSTFSKYQKYRVLNNITGAEAARKILDKNGLYNIRVERVAGSLSDHYDPRSNTIRLSESVYSSTSVAAIGVAAHEAGHAVQHSVDYFPMKIRSAIIPITNIGSSVSFPLIFLGLIFSARPLVLAGIILFSTVAVFQLITLPVEFNASSRAMRILESDYILQGEELIGAKKVLNAAALTYVASLIVAIAQLLRLFLLYGRRNDD